VSQEKAPTFKLYVTLSNPIRFSNFTLLESVWNLLQNPYDTIHLTLDMFLHYLGKLKIQIFCIQQIYKKIQTNCTLIASNFVIHPQILILSVFKIARLFPH